MKRIESGKKPTAVTPMQIELRDYFAGQALAGMSVSDGSRYSEYDRDEGVPERHAMERASAAYMNADAMLAQRETR